MSILALLGLSTTLFSLTIGYYTYQVDNFSGETDIVGTIYDSSGIPLEGVRVESDGVMDRSDVNGFWKIVGVKEGKIDVDFYQPGFIKSRYNWIAYPLDWIKKDDLNGSSNDLSQEEEIILYREINWEEYNETVDINFEIKIWLNHSTLESLGDLSISNETEEWNVVSLSEGQNTFQIVGGGAFSIRSSLVIGTIHWYNSAQPSINLTNEIINFVGSEEVILPDEGNLTIEFTSGLNDNETVSISCYDINLGSYINRSFTFDEMGNNYTLNLPGGSYNVSITGESFIDMGFSRVNINEGLHEHIEVNITMAQTDVLYDGLSITGNYMITIYYLVLSMFLLYGIYLARKGTSWMGFVLLSFISFLSRGIPVVGPMNFNILLATVLVIVAFMMRSDFLIRYREKINAYDRDQADKDNNSNENNK
ncbi:MAG: carboxypeptidase regulatory-like domain-containing protein [Thermoplasmata archaeon]|nr:carboxypeptidase regulatory-like domain-containing protein [Thermoplasmata archaeon]